VLWTERFAGRLEYELADFQERGLDAFTLVEQEFSRGRVVLEGSTSFDGKSISLRVVYPDLFPYFRPEVFAPELKLGRHQNPYEGNLCLLEASTRAWSPTESAAWLVAERVPFLLALIRDGGHELLANEVPQGEPDSYYVPRLHGTAVFIPGGALELPAEAQAGNAYFSFSSDRVGLAVHLLLRQLNGWAKNGGGKPIAVAEDALQARFEGPKVEGRWIRLDKSPGRNADDYFDAAEEVQPGFGSPPWQRIGNDQVAILGVVFKEEVRQGIWEDAWLFAVRFRQSQPQQTGAYVTKGERFAPEDLFARIPRLAGLAQHTVAQIGLGSLGAPVALELARSQLGELRALDFDLVDGGTIVRWPVGVPAVGSAKTHVLQVTVANQYPYTRCWVIDRHLGTASDRLEFGEPRENDFDALARLLDGADLVIDASAELAIQHLVRDLAAERNLPQVFLWGTEGAFGGVVARVLPGITGCWFCLQLAIDDGSITAPPHEPTGTTQPRGCGLPTFTGESFNQLPLVAQAARVATGTLLGTLRHGHDVFVMSLREGDTAAPAPHWTTYALEQHPDCPYCTTSA
jgi:hypothetical protein